LNWYETVRKVREQNRKGESAEARRKFTPSQENTSNEKDFDQRESGLIMRRKKEEGRRGSAKEEKY